MLTILACTICYLGGLGTMYWAMKGAMEIDDAVKERAKRILIWFNK